MSPVRLVAILAIALAATAGYRWLNWDQTDHGPFQMYGNVDIREVELAFRQPGRLAKTLFDEGASVKAGDVMAELDAQPYREALAVAEAEVQRSRAELEKLRRGNRPQEIAQALEAVRQAEAVFHNAESDFKRQSGLAASGSASERVADAARSARDQAQAALASAGQALELKREGFRPEDIAAAAARLRGAEARATQAKTAVSDTRLLAPADGIVISRVREVGSMVNASAAVYILSFRDPVYVRAYVSEPNLGRVVPGTKVTVRTDSNDKVYQGQIGFVSPRAEFTPKSVETTDLRTDLVYRLRIVVANADDGLRQGMPVTVRLATDVIGR
ncbi:MAG: secretion protein HlyD [Betaproteobacteria bacterium RIFCSPLOWO2_02_FULL_63_19]|nr:MAG: secretion protein HlyD [Betaproteobacteria bacterium RIFCSPLOWO2_02_FULL_63_19]